MQTLPNVWSAPTVISYSQTSVMRVWSGNGDLSRQASGGWAGVTC